MTNANRMQSVRRLLPAALCALAALQAGPLAAQSRLVNNSKATAGIGVSTDPATSQLVVTQIVGLVSPPFSSSPTLP